MPDPSSVKILLAEDNIESRQFIEQYILRPAGYSVICANEGETALRIARETSPELLITDFQMPGMNGLELIEHLQREIPHLPSILITSEGSEELALKALRSGATDYLLKPFEADLLLASVERALEKGRRLKDWRQAREQVELQTRGLEQRLEAFETLAVIGRTITAMLNIDEVLKAVVDSAVQLTGAEEGSLLLLDGETGELHMRASKNFEEQVAQSLRLPISDSLAGQVIESGKPVLLDQSSPEKIKTSYLVHSLIYTPLHVRGKTIGVLGVDNREPGHRFRQEDVKVMMVMADYAAIAVENAQLFNQSEAQRQRLEAILSQTENGVIVVDPEERLLLINNAAREALGLRQAYSEALAAEVIEDPHLLGLISSSSSMPLRDELELSDGRVLNVQRTPIAGVGQVIVMHDITHLKELDRIKSEFVTTVSHDLRSPLTSILGYVKLIERAGEVNSNQRDFIRKVEMSVEQISTLVSDLLDLGRIETGLDMTKEDTPISVIARYALESMRGIAEEKGIRFEIDLQEDLPMVKGNPIRLRQMIGNLLDNAIKYTPEDGIVSIEAEAEKDQVILRVRDTGPGISSSEQPYVFDKFFRGSNIPDDASGTGLGLSIVKSIVDNHRGRIWVESTMGEGTAFVVVLPASHAGSHARQPFSETAG